MPRTNYLRDPYEKRREILFGTDKRIVPLNRLSKDTDISRSTLQRYRDHPDSIPFRNLIKIVKWNDMTKEEVWELFK